MRTFPKQHIIKIYIHSLGTTLLGDNEHSLPDWHVGNICKEVLYFKLMNSPTAGLHTFLHLNFKFLT
jgi:hypothetical protein